MKKHIYTNTLAQAALEEEAIRAKSVLQEACDTYVRLNLGFLTEEDLYGNSSSGSHYSGGCKSCQGVLAYAKTLAWIEDKVVEGAEAGMSVGGIKLSKQRLKSIIELPDEEAIIAFDKALKNWKSRFHNLAIASVLSIDKGKVFINENLAKQQKALEFNTTTEEGIQLLEDLETLAALMDSVNTRLKRYHQKPLPIPTDGNANSFNGFAIYANESSGWKLKVNLPLVATFLK